MVTIEKEESKEEPDEALSLQDAMKFFYAILNKYGGKKKTVTMPANEFDDMPEDWADRLAFRHIPEKNRVQAYLRPREDDDEVKIIKPGKRIILPN